MPEADEPKKEPVPASAELADLDEASLDSVSGGIPKQTGGNGSRNTSGGGNNFS